MVKWPKYSREEKLSCKLNDSQIKEIKKMRKNGYSYRDIASDFRVSIRAVFYWCLSEKDRKQKTKDEVKRRSGIKRDKLAQVYARRNQLYYRKKKLYPLAIKKYNIEKAKKRRLRLGVNEDGKETV